MFDPIGEGWAPLKENIFRTFKANRIRDVFMAGKLGWRLIRTSDYITDLSNKKRAYAIDSYKVDLSWITIIGKWRRFSVRKV